MDIGAILSRAWQIVWRHKVLWIFGILASCSGANYGGNSFQFQMEEGELPPALQDFFNNFQITPEQGPVMVAAVLAIIFIVLVLMLLFIFLGTIGRIGLYRGTNQVEQMGATSLSFGELFSGSVPYFWRVFLLNLLVGLAIAAIVIVLTVVLAITVVGLICLIPLICLLVPLGWIISIILELANISIVVENRGIVDGLERGWNLFRDNLGSVVVMGLILVIGVGLIGGFLIGLPFFAIFAPLVGGMIIGSNASAGGGLAISLLCLVLYLPVAIALYGLLQSYVESAWTLTFLRLTRRPALAPDIASAETPIV